MAAWHAAAGARTVLLPQPQSFCAGVERAIDIVEQALVRYPHPVYVRKQIVHNLHVVRDLADRGAVFVDELDEVPRGATVVFSAHGVAPDVHRQARERDLRVIDATCPLVTKVHSEVRRFARRDHQILLIGHAGHEEAIGTLGEAPERTRLVQTEADVAALPDIDGPVAYVTQTTLAMDEVATVVAALRERYPHITGPGSDDVCYATTNRQRAVLAVAGQSDLVYVVGSRNSSNSVRLVELVERAGTPARLVEDVTGVRLAELAGAATVGLTAGASASPTLVAEIVRNLGGLGPVEVVERRITTETITFNRPRELDRAGGDAAS
ncbi:4-hydroxy-3-methylbut-2-enyl diphosphate reductase [Dactylosporangium fulvum]|uniref:4-hydroxy-3-methylbut-2-enyl diphosphate reductase n=1 Tax=Dactylosporangium fulvum TaxID=53359 RepID=UPI0038734ED7